MTQVPDFLEYVFTDVHGCYEQLEVAVARSVEHAKTHGRRPRFIGLGDYVDRGKRSREVIELLMDLDKKYECVWHGGNHEQLMLESCADAERGVITSTVDLWWKEGGRETMLSYGMIDGMNIYEAFKLVPPAHLSFMRQMRVLSKTPHRVYVHAGLAPRVPLEEQDRNTCLWIRDKFLMVANPRTKHLFPGVDYVVHGHTPEWGGKKSSRNVEQNDFRLNLDCGTPWTGVLSVGVFQPEVPGGPLEIIRVEGAPHKQEVKWSRGIR